MLARSGPIPSGDYAFEVKWDGFRAIVTRNEAFRVLLPEVVDHVDVRPAVARLVRPLHDDPFEPDTVAARKQPAVSVVASNVDAGHHPLKAALVCEALACVQQPLEEIPGLRPWAHGGKLDKARTAPRFTGAAVANGKADEFRVVVEKHGVAERVCSGYANLVPHV
jgi:hypothetical protein